MTAPPRIMDDPSASSVLRSDLSRAAESSSGSYDAAQGLLALREAIKADGGSPPPMGGPVGTRPLLKLIGGAGALLGAGLLAALLWPSDPPNLSLGPDFRPRDVAVPTIPVVEQARRDARGSAAAAPGETERRDQPSEPVPEAEEQASPVVTLGKQGRASPMPSVDPDEMMRLEIAHLKKVRAALATNAGEALKLSQEGHQRFAKGILYEEREGLAILALQKLGQMPEAARRAGRFAVRFPKNPLLPQMRSLLRPESP